MDIEIRRMLSHYATYVFKVAGKGPTRFEFTPVGFVGYGTSQSKNGDPTMAKTKALITLVVKTQYVLNSPDPVSWGFLSIKPSAGDRLPEGKTDAGADEITYPLYGDYYYHFRPGVPPRWRTEEKVSKLLLDKRNEELILALKAGLVEKIEL